MNKTNDLNQNQSKTKRLKQTTIEDFFSVINKNIGSNQQNSEMSSDNDLMSSSTSNQITVNCDNRSQEVMDCLEMSPFDEIPETPEMVVPEEEEDEQMDGEEESQLLKTLNRMPNCLLPLPPLRPDSSHFVLFNVPLNRVMDSIPNPFPNSYCDKWDTKHVKMSNSPNNQITSVQTTEGRKVMTRLFKWELIEANLLSDIKSSQQLEEAIKTYNPFAEKYKFDVLQTLFKNCTEEECTQFFDQILPAMIRLALSLPQVVTQSVPLLRQKQNSSLFLSQQQIACLLANAFFCTFPKRSHSNEEYKNYPIINFLSLFASFGYKESIKTKVEKLKCLIKYFQRVTQSMPKGIVSFERRSLNNEEFPVWKDSNKTFKKLVVLKDGVIEDEGKGLLQVDFANKFIGGGVIGSGCVQEEIRFVICPELLISRLFTEKLLDNEVLIICGSQRFSTYSGYSNTFEWTGGYNDDTPYDEWGRRMTRIVAMDALYFNHSEVDIQYERKHFERELNKAFCAFLERRYSEPKNKCAIASGNWGCGAFNGDPLLKTIIQLMAASQADRDLVLFTFNDFILKQKIKNFYTFLTNNNFNVKHLYKGVLLYQNLLKYSGFDRNLDIFEFFMDSKQVILEN